MNPTLGTLVDLAIAVGAGLLIGLQREQSAKGVLAAGSRTFPLISLLGGVTEHYFPRLLPVALGGIVVLSALGYAVRVKEAGDPGLATPIAGILAFFIGALAVISDETQVMAIILAVAVTILLALKENLHAFARRISPDEVRATLLFLVVALVVLPLLPNRDLPALLGLNPRFVWTMVVFVSAVDLVAYLFVKLFATTRGHLLAGVVGGMVSSTATTLSMARGTRGRPETTTPYAIGIVTASMVMLVRMTIEVAALDPTLLRTFAPFALLLVAWCGTLVAMWLRRPTSTEVNTATGPRNPFRLTPALVFGVVFAGLLLLTRWLNNGFGALGIYGAGLVSGTVEVDAVTLSIARLHSLGGVDPQTATAALFLVMAASFAFKIGMIAVVGTRKLLRQVILPLGASLAAAVVGAIWLATS